MVYGSGFGDGGCLLSSCFVHFFLVAGEGGGKLRTSLLDFDVGFLANQRGILRMTGIVTRKRCHFFQKHSAFD